MYLALITILVFASATAKPASPRRWTYGECYNILTPNDFDLKKLTDGVWYEIERNANNFEKNSECVKLTFFLEPDDKQLGIAFSAHFLNGTDGTIGVDGVFEVNENETNIQVTYPGEDESVKLSVVATDFNNYAILYSCVQLSMDVIPEKEENLWVLSRKTYFEDDIKEIVERALVVDGDSIGDLLDPVNQICLPNCLIH